MACLTVALVAFLLLAVPFGALGKPGPLRGQGPNDAAEPTTTAVSSFRQERSAPATHAAASAGQSIRSRSANEALDTRPSLRPRPDAAPVDLGFVAEAPLAPTPAPESAAASTQRAVARVWPLRPGTFEISQPFGCVSQLLGYYPVAPGCPPEAPAVHAGLDLAAPQGTTIYAAASGWVIAAGLDRPSGVANTRIVIQHDGENEGYATEYIHWSGTYVERGQYVRAGDPIASVGSVGYSTGPHLHFAVVDFATGEHIDPIRWLPATPDSAAYLGVTPARAPISYPEVSIPVPDYADPAPPPIPNEQPVPDQAPDFVPAEQPLAPTPSPIPSEPEPTAAPAIPVDPTAAPAAPAPTVYADHADDSGASGQPRRQGPSNEDEDRGDRRNRDRDPERERTPDEAPLPEPTVQVPPPVPPVPPNPNVAAPAQTDDTGDRGGRNKKNRD